MSGTTEINVLYFARLRDKIGLEGEAIALSDEVGTVGDLFALLQNRSDAHASALADDVSIRAAVDQQHADMETPLSGAREVAFFPPMTGG
ncbi:MAG: molybdopterin converting factor subunit 1 [Pseudomonadota bacterium]